MDINNIDELVKHVNAELLKGNSTAKIELALGVGKDTIRKKLNRAGYNYNKITKQFMVLTHNATQDNTKEDVIFKSKPKKSVAKENKKMELTLTAEEIKFVKELYKKHNITQDVNALELGEIITRSIRVDKSVIDSFAVFCKENNLTQINAVTKALKDFMDNYNKED